MTPSPSSAVMLDAVLSSSEHNLSPFQPNKHISTAHFHNSPSTTLAFPNPAISSSINSSSSLFPNKLYSPTIPVPKAQDQDFQKSIIQNHEFHPPANSSLLPLRHSNVLGSTCSTKAKPLIVVLWDTYSKGNYPHDLLLRLYQRFLQLYPPGSDNVSYSVVCTSPWIAKENFPLESFSTVRWIEATDVAMVTEVLRMSIAGVEHLTVISENPCLSSALKHLVENGRVHIDWVSLSNPCRQALPQVTHVPMDQFLKPCPVLPQNVHTVSSPLPPTNLPSFYSHEGRLKLLMKMVPIAPPPCTNHISLAWVSFGPLYHALQHPSIRERLGPHYELPIDLSLLGGILKTAMEPFASLKFYLQAAQELGLVKLLHHGSRCLLKVTFPDRLQLWAKANPNSTLISSNLIPSNGALQSNNGCASGFTAHSFSTSLTSTTASNLINLPQRSLTERELAPFLPLLHAFCLARMRYPPPIRTPAIGPLLKPLFAQNQLPWKKLSEYLAEAERQGVIRLNKLGVNGDVQIWICEQVCGDVWQRLKQRHGPFREATQEPAPDAHVAEYRNHDGARPLCSNFYASNHHSSLPSMPYLSEPPATLVRRQSSPYFAGVTAKATAAAAAAAAPPSHPGGIPDQAGAMDISKLWETSDVPAAPAPRPSVLSSSFGNGKSLAPSSVFLPLSSTSWGSAASHSVSSVHTPSGWSPTENTLLPKKTLSMIESARPPKPQESIYTPWNTPSFLPLECGQSSTF